VLVGGSGAAGGVTGAFVGDHLLMLDLRYLKISI
jgi:hypothetical protein